MEKNTIVLLFNTAMMAILVHNIPTLLFLPPEEIKQTFEVIKNVLLNDIALWFDKMYVNTKIRDDTVQRSPLLFPSTFWSIHHNNENRIPRT